MPDVAVKALGINTTCFQVLFGSRVEEPSLAYLQNCLRDLETVATIGAKGKADTK